MNWKVLEGDCVEVMRGMDADSVDAVVTDPPYFLHFMGRKWDHAPTPREQQAQHEAWAREALRVLKPGGHLLAAGGTRTFHRLVCAIEDAGFEIRDTVQWIYGSGFPKSLNVGKAIDKMAGAEREVVGMNGNARSTRSDKYNAGNGFGVNEFTTAPATEAAQAWEGWGTALKPSHEPVVLARKPLAESSVARQVLSTGTGALNVDGSRVGLTTYDKEEYIPNRVGYKDGIEHKQLDGDDVQTAYGRLNYRQGEQTPVFNKQGRWPANLLLSHSPECHRTGEVRRVKASQGAGVSYQGHEGWMRPGHANYEKKSADEAGYADPDGTEAVEAWECQPDCPVRLMDEQSATSKKRLEIRTDYDDIRGGNLINDETRTLEGQPRPRNYDGEGGASRFFQRFERYPEPGFQYVAKASRAERNRGLEGMPEKPPAVYGEIATSVDGRPGRAQGARTNEPVTNNHPTVKPIALMRYLCRLICPPGGTVLDPFTGSGSTGCAAVLEGFDFIGIEREPEYAEIARRRIAHWSGDKTEPVEPLATLF